MLAPPELRRIHPLGKSPVLEDNGIVVAESGAIIEYVLDVHGGGRLRPPPRTAAARDFTYFLHYAEGSLMSPLLLALVFARLPKEKIPFFAKPIVTEVSKKVLSVFISPQLRQHAGFLEQHLERNHWFAGEDFSAADIQMSFPVQALMARGGLRDSCPRLADFVARIESRPAYARALERGGPFEILGGGE